MEWALIKQTGNVQSFKEIALVETSPSWIKRFRDSAKAIEGHEPPNPLQAETKMKTAQLQKRSFHKKKEWVKRQN